MSRVCIGVELRVDKSLPALVSAQAVPGVPGCLGLCFPRRSRRLPLLRPKQQQLPPQTTSLTTPSIKSLSVLLAPPCRLFSVPARSHNSCSWCPTVSPSGKSSRTATTIKNTRSRSLGRGVPDKQPISKARSPALALVGLPIGSSAPYLRPLSLPTGHHLR